MSLVIGTGGDQGDALELSEFRVVFSVHHGVAGEAPKTMVARIYNLSDATASKLRYDPKTVKRVVLSAGFKPQQYGTLFAGDVTYTRKGRENATDTYLDIFATDGDQARNFAVVNANLGPGTTGADAAKLAVAAMNPYGVTLDPNSKLPGTDLRYPRGRLLYGPARETLHDVAASSGMAWTIENGQVAFQPVVFGAPPPSGGTAAPSSGTATPAWTGHVTDLSSLTGMILIPEQTQDGIVVRTLINPFIRAGSYVRIAQSDIAKAAISQNWQATNILPSLADNGIYGVWFIDHHGDTRGNDWYSDMTCESADANAVIPPGAKSVIKAVPD